MGKEKPYILVTGGAGFIGSHTVVRLIEEGYFPIIVDDFRNAHPDVIGRLEEITQQKIIYFPYDCRDTKKVRLIFEKYPIWGIIHFAAYKAVGESIERPYKYYKNNIESTIRILDLANEFKVKEFVFSSSCTVYGNPVNKQVKEDFPISYLTPYGYTKKVGEELVEQFIQQNPSSHATLLRYFNPIGAHESGLIGEEPNNVPNNLLPYITQTVNGKRKSLTVFGNDYATPDGTCVRDYVHVVDLADAHVRVLSINHPTSNPSIYNVGLGKGTSVLKIITTFETVTGKKVPYKIGKRRPGDIDEIYANTEKIQKELNWQPKYNIKDALSSAWKFEKTIEKKRRQL